MSMYLSLGSHGFSNCHSVGGDFLYNSPIVCWWVEKEEVIVKKSNCKLLKIKSHIVTVMTEVQLLNTLLKWKWKLDLQFVYERAVDSTNAFCVRLISMPLFFPTSEFVAVECQSSTGHSGQPSKLDCVVKILVKPQNDLKILKVFWKKDGQQVLTFDGSINPENERFQFADTNWRTSKVISLLVKDTKVSDEGIYSSTVVTTRGITRGDARLDVKGKPLFHLQVSISKRKAYIMFSSQSNSCINTDLFCNIVLVGQVWILAPTVLSLM